MGKVAFLAVGFRAAAKALVAGNPARSALENASMADEILLSDILLFMGDDASVLVQHCAGVTLPNTLSSVDGFRLRLHWSCQYLHVHIRRHQVLLSLPFRST